MPKFTVKTTVTYEFDVEAKDYAQAILLGNNWDKFNWNREIEDIKYKGNRSGGELVPGHGHAFKSHDFLNKQDWR